MLVLNGKTLWWEESKDSAKKVKTVAKSNFDKINWLYKFKEPKLQSGMDRTI